MLSMVSKIPSPKEISYPQYKMEKPIEQHQFALLYVRHNVFKGNSYR